MEPHSTPQLADRPPATPGRRRGPLLGAGIFVLVIAAAITAIFAVPASTPPLAPGQAPAGLRSTLALLRGIPQHGETLGRSVCGQANSRRSRWLCDRLLLLFGTALTHRRELQKPAETDGGREVQHRHIPMSGTSENHARKPYARKAACQPSG